jgi:hypothetical protein
MIGWCAAAWAAETGAESTHDRFTSMKDLQVQTELVRPLTEPVTLVQGPERLTLQSGWLVPVFSGKLAGEWQRTLQRWAAAQDRTEVPRLPNPEERAEQELVGFVWTGGTATLSLALPDRADAEILANRMVRALGVPQDELAAFVRQGQPLSVQVSDAVILGVDPRLDAVFAGPEQHDPYEIIVVGASKEAEKAAQHARDVFSARSGVWEAVELQPGERIAWDRIAAERDVRGPADLFRMWDLSTSVRYGLVAPQMGGEIDRWLAVMTDPTGQIDPRREIRISSLGRPPSGGAVDGLVGGIPHPPERPEDLSSAPRPRLRVEPVLAESTVTLQPTEQGALAVHVDSRLTFRAVGGPMPWIDLELPKTEVVPGSFQVLEAALADGTPLLGRAVEEVAARTAPAPEPAPAPAPTPEPAPGPRPAPAPEPLAPPAEQGTATLRLQLPAPVPAGAEVTVHLVHDDTWPLQNQGEVWTGTISAGVGSGLQGFLPSVGGQALGSPWPMKARVGVPASGKLVATLSGRTLREWEQDGWQLTEADSEGHAAWFPSISAGRYKTVDDPSQLGFPAVRVRLQDQAYGAIDDFAPEVRRVISFYEGWLPRYPVREVEIFESPNAVLGFAWIAPHGMVSVQRMLTYGTMQGDASSLQQHNVRNGQPHLEHAVFAHELAHQYFGHMAPPASVEDFWIAESFSELFSCMYVSAAFEPRDCRVRQDGNRKEWEASDRPSVNPSLSRAYYDGARGPVVYSYGPYLLGEMLQRRIGLQPFFGAVDLVLREHPYEPLTTERLQQYLEGTSGRDLGAFFDFWVHGGYVPAVDLTWSAKGGKLLGEVTSDVPFGTFDVPVVVKTKGGAAEAWVTVTDGRGQLELALPPGKVTQVELDPAGFIVASRRTVRQQR